MTAEVLPQVLSGESHAGLSPLKIWDLLIRLIRRFTLSNEELQLLEIVRGAASTIGRPVLSAASLEDLDSKLDQFVSSPELLKIVQQSARALTLSSLEAALTAPTISPEFVAVLGAGPAKKLEQFFPLVGAAVSVMFQHFTISPECWIEGPNEEQFADILYNPELPLQVRKCLFAGLRADVASLAVAAALMGDQVRIPLEPWLAQALVEQMVRGQYQRVGLLADT